MIIAVTYENENVYEHFGHANQLMLYTVEDKEIVDTLLVECDQVNGHTAMTELLADHDVSVLICQNIGAGAIQALEEHKILVYPGVEGNATEAVLDFLQGKLSFNPNTMCDHHHGHENGGCGCGGSCGCHGGCGCGQEEEIELPPVKDFEYQNPQGGVVTITRENFDEELSGHGYVIIVEFGTKWCAPCKELFPRFEALSKEFTNIKFCTMDCDEEPELANSLQISSVPTMLIIKGNAIIDELIGAYPDEEIKKALERAVAFEL